MGPITWDPFEGNFDILKIFGVRGELAKQFSGPKYPALLVPWDNDVKVFYMSNIRLTDLHQKFKEDFGVVKSERVARVENGTSFCVDLLADKEKSCVYGNAVDNWFFRPSKEITGTDSTCGWRVQLLVWIKRRVDEEIVVYFKTNL